MKVVVSSVKAMTSRTIVARVLVNQYDANSLPRADERSKSGNAGFAATQYRRSEVGSMALRALRGRLRVAGWMLPGVRLGMAVENERRGAQKRPKRLGGVV